MTLGALVGFPNPVNAKASRVVGAFVAVTTLLALVTHWSVVMWLIAAGYLLRVLSGPRFSPFALVATRVVAPRLGPADPVAGPPKRFAQGIGLTVSLGSAVALASGHATLGWVLAGVLLLAATLESAVGVCLGCIIFGWLQRAGLVPASVCLACNDLSYRRPAR